MRSIISSFARGCHHGKGGKHTRKGNYERALSHFQRALEYAETCGDESAVPVEAECVARTHFRLGNYDEAKKYASKSLALYTKLENYGEIFKESIRRTKELIDLIDRQAVS